MTFVADFTPEQLRNASAGRRYGQRKWEAQKEAIVSESTKEHPGIEILPYERLFDEESLQKAVTLYSGEHLLVLRPFGWHLDGRHIPNMAEHLDRGYVCDELRVNVVCEYGPYIAVVRKR